MSKYFYIQVRGKDFYNFKRRLGYTVFECLEPWGRVYIEGGAGNMRLLFLEERNRAKFLIAWVGDYGVADHRGIPSIHDHGTVELNFCSNSEPL